MWDWILVAELIEHFFFGGILGGMLTFLFLAAFFAFTGKDEDNINTGYILLWLFLTAVGAFGTSFCKLPESLVNANINRVKINYTSPQAISKIESGALKVVDRLDKLIDKGIESIDNKPK